MYLREAKKRAEKEHKKKVAQARAEERAAQKAARARPQGRLRTDSGATEAMRALEEAVSGLFRL